MARGFGLALQRGGRSSSGGFCPRRLPCAGDSAFNHALNRVHSVLHVLIGGNGCGVSCPCRLRPGHWVWGPAPIRARSLHPRAPLARRIPQRGPVKGGQDGAGARVDLWVGGGGGEVGEAAVGAAAEAGKEGIASTLDPSSGRRSAPVVGRGSQGGCGSAPASSWVQFSSSNAATSRLMWSTLSAESTSASVPVRKAPGSWSTTRLRSAGARQV